MPDMKTLPRPDAMYRALVERDPAYEGVFVVAVRTTSIYCRPTCTARKPRRKNVEFFATAAEAEAEGYRACRRCRPREPVGAPPGWLRFELADGVSSARARRWFRKHHGVTYRAWRRGARLSGVVESLRRGDRIVDVAYDAGYEAPSAFVDAFKKAAGVPPSASRVRRVVIVKRLATPLGPMWAGAIGEGICLLRFGERAPEGLRGDHPHFARLEAQLAEYFAGRRRAFDVPLALEGTAFQRAMWKKLSAIPYGETRSYGDLGPARAAGRACATNPVWIVVPCHRVVGIDGNLVGYGGGVWRKKRLLELEHYGSAASTRRANAAGSTAG